MIIKRPHLPQSKSPMALPGQRNTGKHHDSPRHIIATTQAHTDLAWHQSTVVHCCIAFVELKLHAYTAALQTSFAIGRSTQLILCCYFGSPTRDGRPAPIRVPATLDIRLDRADWERLQSKDCDSCILDGACAAPQIGGAPD